MSRMPKKEAAPSLAGKVDGNIEF